MHLGAGAAELSKIISARAKRENSFTRTYQQPDFSTIDSCTYFPYFLYFIRSMKLYPPPALLSTVFVRFSTIFYFLPLLRLFFGNFCVFKQKVIHTHRLWITRFYFLCRQPIFLFGRQVLSPFSYTKKVRQPKLPHKNANSIVVIFLFYVLLRCETHKNFLTR